MSNPARDLASHIATLSPMAGVRLQLDRNVFHGPERPVKATIPAEAIFVENEAGASKVPYMGESRDWNVHVVSITVRSNPSAYHQGEDLAIALNERLQRNPPAGYVACHAQQTSPDYDGEDEERIHSWLLTFELWRAG